MGSAMSYVSSFLESTSGSFGKHATFDLWVQLFTVMMPIAIATLAYATELIAISGTTCLPPSNFTADSSAAYINAYCSTKDNENMPFVIYHEFLPVMLGIQALMAHQSLMYWHYRGLERMKADIQFITSNCDGLFTGTLDLWASLVKSVRAHNLPSLGGKGSIIEMIANLVQEENESLATKVDGLKVEIKTIQTVVNKYNGFSISKTYVKMRRCFYLVLTGGAIFQAAQIIICWYSGGILKPNFKCMFQNFEVPCAKHMEVVYEILMCLNLFLCLVLPIFVTLRHDHKVIWCRRKRVKYIYEVIPLIRKPTGFDDTSHGNDLQFLSMYIGQSLYSIETLGDVIERMYPCPTLSDCPNFKEVLIYLLGDDRELQSYVSCM